MNIDSKTRLLGLFGYPVKHSLSPLIQNHLINHYKLNYVYLAFEPRRQEVKEAFISASNLGFLGLNITMPFKKEIIGLIQKISFSSYITESVNTVKFDDSKVKSSGYNTDTYGVIKSLEDKGFSWNGKNCLIIGAGGVARSAVFSMLAKPVDKIFIYNVRSKKAIRLIESFRNNTKKVLNRRNNLIEDEQEINYRPCDIKKKITALPDLNSIKEELDSIDLIINCTPIGMDIKDYVKLMPIPDDWILRDKYIFDMVYKPVETRFLKKARKDGAKQLINGVDMLVNQGIYSFKIWFGIMPDKKIIEQIKNKIKDYLWK